MALEVGLAAAPTKRGSFDLLREAFKNTQLVRALEQRKAKPPESTVPRDKVYLREKLQDTLYDGQAFKSEFQAGAQALMEIVGTYPIFGVSQETLLLDTLLARAPYNEASTIEQHLINWYRTSTEHPDQKNAKLRSARALLAELRPLRDQLKIEQCALEWQNMLSKEDTQISLTEEVTKKEYICDERSIGSDIVIFMYPKHLTPELQTKLQISITAVTKAWTTIRESPVKQTFRVLLTPYNVRQLRAHAEMRLSPSTIIGFNETAQDVEDVAMHETIHAGIGAEGGYPQSTDFAEGCAERLAVELGVQADVVTNKVSQHATLLAQLNDLVKIRSSTTALDVMQQRGYDETHIKQMSEKFNYLWGYFLIDALLSNVTYNKIQANWLSSGRKRFSLIVHINKLYAQTFQEFRASQGITLRQRDLLARVFLEKLGFTTLEFNGLMHQVDARIQAAAKNVKGGKPIN